MSGCDRRMLRGTWQTSLQIAKLIRMFAEFFAHTTCGSWPARLPCQVCSAVAVAPHHGSSEWHMRRHDMQSLTLLWWVSGCTRHHTAERGAAKPQASIRVGFAILHLVAIGVALQEVLMHTCPRTPRYTTVFGTYLRQALSIATWFSTVLRRSSRWFQ